MTMWDPVPWSVGGGPYGGPEHTPEMLRLMAYAATLGAEGIVGGSNAKVTALTVPAGQVNVAAGSAVLLNKYAGGAGGQQSYIARLGAQDTVSITATGGAARSDLVVVRVQDPQYEGSYPVDPDSGQYAYTAVIAGVPAGTTDTATLGLGYPAIALARIDIPASTGTITNAMITDVRQMVRGRSKRISVVLYPVIADQVDTTKTSGDPDGWPNAGSTNVAIPGWATTATMRADVAGAYGYGGNCAGQFRVQLDTLAGGYSKWSAESGAGAAGQRINLIAGGTVAIGSGLRGTTKALKTMAYRSSGAAGSLRVDDGSTVILEIEFTETPT